MHEYTSVMLEKTVLNMPEFLICTNYSGFIETDVFRTLSSISDGAFCKKSNAWVQVHNQKFFSLRGEGRFDKSFVKNMRKRDPSGKDFGIFSPRYS